MSWSQTYTYTLALAIDRFGAAVLFNEPDITISSLCWIVVTAERHAAWPIPPDQKVAFAALRQLTLATWQYRFLRAIGNQFLERFWPGHCARARLTDLATTVRSRGLLGA